MITMKEDLKTIFYMGLGAISETSDKMKEIKEELFEKGKNLYEKGVIANEELKHNINEIIKEKDNKNTKETILKHFDNLSAEEQKDILKELNKKRWNDVKDDKGEHNN